MGETSDSANIAAGNSSVSLATSPQRGSHRATSPTTRPVVDRLRTYTPSHSGIYRESSPARRTSSAEPIAGLGSGGVVEAALAKYFNEQHTAIARALTPPYNDASLRSTADNGRAPLSSPIGRANQHPWASDRNSHAQHNCKAATREHEHTTRSPPEGTSTPSPAHRVGNDEAFDSEPTRVQRPSHARRSLHSLSQQMPSSPSMEEAAQNSIRPQNHHHQAIRYEACATSRRSIVSDGAVDEQQRPSSGGGVRFIQTVHKATTVRQSSAAQQQAARHPPRAQRRTLSQVDFRLPLEQQQAHIMRMPTIQASVTTSTVASGASPSSRPEHKYANIFAAAGSASNAVQPQHHHELPSTSSTRPSVSQPAHHSIDAHLLRQRDGGRYGPWACLPQTSR